MEKESCNTALLVESVIFGLRGLLNHQALSIQGWYVDYEKHVSVEM